MDLVELNALSWIRLGGCGWDVVMGSYILQIINILKVQPDETDI